MNHLSRLLSILTILKSKRLTTGTELAKKFEVSLRTIYRDIRKLEESGVPVITIEGKGYSIMEGYQIAPIMFDEMEVNALITAEQLIAKTNDESLIKHFEQTLWKIKSVFKSSLQSKGEFLNKKMWVFKRPPKEEKSSSLSYIQFAIINFRVTEIAYQAREKEVTKRKIEPLSIYSYDEKWIVIGWCRLRKDYRSFRLDRIQEFRVLEEAFDDRNFDMIDYFISQKKNKTTPDTFRHNPNLPLSGKKSHFKNIHQNSIKMTTKEIAEKWADYCRTNQWDKAHQELYANHCVSIEPEGAIGPQKVEGMEAIAEKGKHWGAAVEAFHGVEIEGPIVAGSHFTATMKMDITYKGQSRRKDEEVCVFQVENGKIVSEQFFYPVK